MTQRGSLNMHFTVTCEVADLPAGVPVAVLDDHGKMLVHLNASACMDEIAHHLGAALTSLAECYDTDDSMP